MRLNCTRFFTGEKSKDRLSRSDSNNLQPTSSETAKSFTYFKKPGPSLRASYSRLIFLHPSNVYELMDREKKEKERQAFVTSSRVLTVSAYLKQFVTAAYFYYSLTGAIVKCPTNSADFRYRCAIVKRETTFRFLSTDTCIN